jgi:hypothetical protein
VLNGAVMVPSVMFTFEKLGPAAVGYFQNLATVASLICSVDQGGWMRIACRYLSCALVCDLSIVSRHHCHSLARSAGNDLHEGAVVPFT